MRSLWIRPRAAITDVVTRGLARALCCSIALALACGAALAGVRDGDRAFEAGRHEEALRYYEAAARSGSAEAQAGIGRVRLAQLRLDDALQAFRRAHELDPALALAWWGEGEALKRQGKCADAVPRFEKATSLDRKFPQAQLSLHPSCHARPRDSANR